MKLTRNPLYSGDAGLEPDQLKARRLWQRANSRLTLLHDALMVCPEVSRECLHAALDTRLNDVDRMRARALQLDPKVRDRLTIASGTFKV